MITYLFEWGMFVNSAQSFRVQLVVNGGAITNYYISGHNAGMGSGHSMPAGHQIINLAANDSVQIGFYPLHFSTAVTLALLVIYLANL